MKQPVEDIQNRVRNHLCPFQIAIDIIENITNECNEEKLHEIINFIKKSNLKNNLIKQIDWFISFGGAMDKKINDKSFDVELYIKNKNLTKC